MSGKCLRDKALLDTDWRVRVAGVQAHSAAGDVSAIAQRLSAIATEFKTSVDRIAGPDRHEVVALFEAALNHPSRPDVVRAAEEIYAAVQTKKPGPQFKDTGRAEVACAAATVTDHARRRLQRTKTCGYDSFPPRFREPWMVKGDGHGPAGPLQGVGRTYPKLTTVGRVFVLRTLTEPSHARVHKAFESPRKFDAHHRWNSSGTPVVNSVSRYRYSR